MGVKRSIMEPVLPEGEVRVALVVARYNQWITDRLRDGAASAFERLVGERGVLVETPVPGTFELPAVAAAAAATGRFHAIVCLGCVIKGETEHDRHLATAVAQSLAQLSMENGGLAVAFGVLTVDNKEQAEARAGGSMGNKGEEAMEAALVTAGAVEGLSRFTEEGARR